jgi:hypothetical protein
MKRKKRTLMESIKIMKMWMELRAIHQQVGKKEVLKY